MELKSYEFYLKNRDDFRKYLWIHFQREMITLGDFSVRAKVARGTISDFMNDKKRNLSRVSLAKIYNYIVELEKLVDEDK